jgi:hypothetical protein
MKTNELPTGVLKSDLARPSYDSSVKLYKGESGHDYNESQFELWFTTGFGWCIPTLSISRARRANTTDRTYAVRVKDGAAVRIGKGPHVTECVTVYVRMSRLKSLKPFLELRLKGQGDAGQIRDRISSRRAQGQVMRAEGRSSWRWDV